MEGEDTGVCKLGQGFTFGDLIWPGEQLFVTKEFLICTTGFCQFLSKRQNMEIETKSFLFVLIELQD